MKTIHAMCQTRHRIQRVRVARPSSTPEPEPSDHLKRLWAQTIPFWKPPTTTDPTA